MGELLGQPIVVDNVGAAAGTVGSQRVAKAAPDGYTMLIGNTGTHAYSQSLYKRPLYNSVTDFQPVGLVSDSPRILLARKDLPANNLQEFIAYAKANQASMQFGSAGVGSGTHLPCVLFNLTLGLNITHVPYRGAGAGDAGPDRRPHRLHVRHHPDRRAAGQAGQRQGHRRDGSASACRSSPSWRPPASRGVAGVEATVWNAFFLPQGTPDPIVRKLNKAMNDMIENAVIRKKLEELGLEIVPPEQRTPEYLAKYLPQEVERWGKVIKAAGISVD